MPNFAPFFCLKWHLFCPKSNLFSPKLALGWVKLGWVKAGPTAGARRASMHGPEGFLCRTGLGLGPKSPNPSWVVKSGPKPGRPRA